MAKAKLQSKAKGKKAVPQGGLTEGQCETVRVVSDEHDDGFKVINKSDFDSKVHTLYTEEDE